MYLNFQIIVTYLNDSKITNQNFRQNLNSFQIEFESFSNHSQIEFEFPKTIKYNTIQKNRIESNRIENNNIFYSILPCFILFYSFLFCSISLFSILHYSVLFYFFIFYFTSIISIVFYKAKVVA